MILIPGVASREVRWVVLRQGKRIGRRRSISQRRPGGRRGPYAAASRFCEGVRHLVSTDGTTRYGSRLKGRDDAVGVSARCVPPTPHPPPAAPPPHPVE